MKIIVLVGLFFSSLIIKNMYQFGYGLNDAFWRVVWNIDEGTIWTKGFSEEKFSLIKLGMTKNQVTKILGDPLNNKLELAQSSFWYYTQQDTGTSDFDQRWVIFNSSNRVSEIRKSFYID